MARLPMKILSPTFAAAVVFGGLGLGIGCGPSYQVIHEGEARFEHCYALDESATATLTTKAACWDDFIRNHTYGQTRDRLAYAVRRRTLLQQVPELPTDEALMMAAPGGGAAQGNATPAPTNVYAPPPRLQGEQSRDAGAGNNPNTIVSLPAAAAALPTAAGSANWVAPASSTASGISTPYDTCLKTCREGWDGCAATNKAGIPKCDATYKSCLRNCLK